MMEVIKRTNVNTDELLKGIFKTPKVKTPALEVLELEVKPGSALKPHDMPSKVVFFVIEGTGTFTYGDRTEIVNPGEMIHVDPGELRFWANNTDKTVRLLVVKSLTEG